MKKNIEVLNHALHNEKVCSYLSLKAEYTDWIITTAFYTALHFVSHKVFPMRVKGKNPEAFELVFENIYQFQYFRGTGLSKHKLLQELAFRYCPEIAPDYHRLHDMSHNARYINYRQPREVANLAQALMHRIKQFCTKG